MRSQRPLRPCSRAVSPVVALCWLFPGGAETCPARAAEATSERVAGTEERPVPVILNEVKNPSSPLRVNRDGTGSTDPSTQLRSAQDDNNERLVRKSHRALAKDGFANPPIFTRPRRGKQSRRLSTACRRVPGRSPDPLLLTKRREEMKSFSLASQKFYYRKEIQFV